MLRHLIPNDSRRCAVALLAPCAAVLLADLACAPDRDLPTPSRELTLSGEGHLEVLDNGLTLFVAPDPYTRLVQLDVRMQVGSRDDPPDRIGTAHFVEHLMFQLPSGDPGSPTLLADAGRRALWFNAWTAADDTHYGHVVDAEGLEVIIQHTAKRLSFDCEAIDDETFAREREVVRNELRWRTGGIDNEIGRAVLAQVFPEGHPYRILAGGTDTGLAAITRDDVCDFIAGHYTPSRATMVVTGDVSLEQVLPLVEAQLAPLPAREPEPRRPMPPLALAGRHERLEVPTKQSMALVLFELPPRFSAEHTAAEAAVTTVELAVSLFTGERNSEVLSWYPVRLGGNQVQVFGVAVVPKRPERLAKAVEEVHDVVGKVMATELDQSRLYDRMRQLRRRGIVESVAWMPARAETHADYLEGGVSPSYVLEELAALDDLTPSEVHALGRRLFAREQALVIELVPNGKEVETDRAELDYDPRDDERLALPDDIDPAEAHRPLAFDEVAPPELQQLDYRLDNGMRVLLVQSSQFPVMDAQVIVGAGLLDAPEHPELPLLAARLYGPHEGGRFGSSRDAHAFLRLFDQAGAQLRSSFGPRSTTYRASGLSIYLDFLLAGLGERVVQGEYQSGTFDAWHQAYRGRLEDPEIARAIEIDRTVTGALYGHGHPHVYAESGDLEALRRLGQRDLWRFHDEHYRAANCTIVIVGGFDMELATRYVEAFFGSPRLRRRRSSWQEPRVERSRPVVPEPEPTSTIFTVTSDDFVQTSVTVDFPLAEIYGEDHAALVVLAKMVDLEVSAVRERLGASYGIGVELQEDRPRLEISGEVDSERSGEAVAEVLAALERLREGDELERRFAFARRGAFREQLQIQGDSTLLANTLAHAVRNGRSYDYHRELARRIATLTPEDVRERIDAVLDPTRAVVLLQGPPQAVQQAIEHNRLEGVKVLFEDQ